MQLNAKVAIVTRTKNRPHMLTRALDSILGQVFSDYMLIIVNDSAEREPVEQLIESRRQELDGRVMIIHNDSPQGRWGAMDTAIAAAETEFFILHDDDDSWHPEFLQQTVRHLEATPDDVAVGTRTELIFEEVRGETIVEVRRQMLATDLSTVSLVEMLKQNYVPPIALLLRRSVFAEIGTFDNSLPVLADWDFTLRLVSRFNVGFLDGEPLAYWHHRESSTGDEGNSVVADALNHQQYNLRIRDKFLRQSLQNGENLGPMLLVAELFRELDTRATAARSEQSRVFESSRRLNADHIEVVHASIVTEFSTLHHKISSQNDEIATLNHQISTLDHRISEVHADVVRMIDLQQAPSFAARVIRRLRRIRTRN
jgi:glycosyltransferase involved in cell wall biosynthesis